MATKFISQFRKKVKKIIPTRSKRRLEESYEVKETIGSGNYSEVKLGVNKKSGEEVALKIIDKDALHDMDRENILVEIDLLRNNSQHPSIISLKEVFEDRKKITIVMELMRGGEFLTRLQKKKFYPENEAAVISRKLIDAINYLHQNGVVHRDLKPENMLFTSDAEDSEIKIADFGFARYIGDGVLSTPCGSPLYVAPEIVKEQEYNKTVDMWSMGVILYIMLSGYPPFYHTETEKIFAQIEKGDFDFPDPYWTKISDSAKDLITRCLKVDPTQRITASEALRHPWLSNAALRSDSKQSLKIPIDLPPHQKNSNMGAAHIDSREETVNSAPKLRKAKGARKNKESSSCSSNSEDSQ